MGAQWRTGVKAEGLEAERSVRSKNVNKVGAGIIMLMREVRGSLNGGGRLGRACGGVTESDGQPVWVWD